VFAVNVKGALHPAQAVVPSMQRRRSGTILNISSLGAQASLPGYAAYSSSKGAIEAFTRALAVELAPWNIRVNAISPGHIDTPANIEDILGDSARAQRYLARIALGRIGRMDEVGKTAAFLVSEDAGYITGQVIQVEGGIAMWQGPIQ
jgi:3-oxoacyl-[acyl-carrier protein] reductase